MLFIWRLYADAFRGLPADVWRLSAGLLVNRAGTMVLPFLSLYLIRELEFETAAASAVLLVFGLGSVAGSYLGGELSGRWGALRVQLLSLGLSGAGFLWLTQVRSFLPLAVGVFVVGAVNDAFRPGGLSAVVEASPTAARTRSWGLLRLAANAGMAIGPAAGGLLAGFDYRLIFVGEAFTCWLAAIWLWRTLSGREIRVPEARAAAAGKKGPPPWKDGPFLALLGLVFLSVLVLFQAFFTLPLYLTTDYGFNEWQVGLTFAFNALLIILFEMLLIRWLEHRDHALILGFGMFLMCAGFGLLPWGRGVAFVLFAVSVWTVGEMLIFPFSNDLVAHRAAAGRTGQAMGMYTATFSVSMVLAPAIGLPMLEHVGGEVFWTAAGLIGLPTWILMSLLARSLRKPLP